MNDILKYIDEEDKCYGIAGMAISLMIFDSEDILASVSLDSEAEHSIAFTPESGFTGNPRYSAKLAWNQILKQFQVSTGMLLSNVMCRNYVHSRRRMSDRVLNTLRALVREEGMNACSLERDETDSIFNKSFSYFDNLYTHSGVHTIAVNFVNTLQQRRSLSASEVFEELKALSML